MVGVPELGLNEELIPGDDASAEELLQRLADHVFVAVIVGRVNKAVAGLHNTGCLKKRTKTLTFVIIFLTADMAQIFRLLFVITLFLTSNVSRLRACLSRRLERFHGCQKKRRLGTS